MWPFKKKAPPPKPRDKRDWNDDWRAGDTAECVCDSWHESVKPWQRPRVGQRLTVAGFSEGRGVDNTLRYFLHFADWPLPLPTTGFRKVRPVAKEQSEIVERILTAKPGADRVREDAPTADDREVIAHMAGQEVENA